MECRVISLRQQQQQIQPSDFAPLAAVAGVGAVGRFGELIEGEELLVVACEGVGLLEADGEESAGFEGLARKSEDVRGGRRGRDQGVECEEFAFGGGEERSYFLRGEGGWRL